MKYSIPYSFGLGFFCAFLLAPRPYFDSAGSVPILMRAFTSSSFCSRLDLFFWRDLLSANCTGVQEPRQVPRRHSGNALRFRQVIFREQVQTGVIWLVLAYLFLEGLSLTSPLALQLGLKTGRVQCRLERLRFKSCHSSEPSKGTVHWEENGVDDPGYYNYIGNVGDEAPFDEYASDYFAPLPLLTLS